MATGGGPSVADLADDPLMELATPYLLHHVEAPYDSDAIALQGCSSGHVNRSASPLASFGHLTGTPILDEDIDDSDESQNHPSPQSTLRAEWSFPTSQDEREPTLSSRSSSSQSRFSTNLSGGEEPLPYTSCARDDSISRNSARMVSFANSVRITPNDSTECGREQSRPTPSATVVRSSSACRAEDTPTLSRGRDRKRSLSTSTAGVASVSQSECARGSSTVHPMQSLGCSSGTGGETPIRRANVSGDGTISGTARNRLGVFREEHDKRMLQHDTISQNREELHNIRLREARVGVEAAEARARAEASQHKLELRILAAKARAEEARADNLEEQLRFDRLRRSRLARSARDESPPL